MTNTEYAESLRLLADWYESHPEIKPPYNADTHRYVATTRGEMEQIARALGTCEKEYTDGLFYLRKKMNHVTFEAFCHRGEVCERVVVGTKHVEERSVPAHTVPAHFEDIVEWKCFDSPLLAPSQTAIVTQELADDRPR